MSNQIIAIQCVSTSLGCFAGPMDDDDASNVDDGSKRTITFIAFFSNNFLLNQLKSLI